MTVSTVIGPGWRSLRRRTSSPPATAPAAGRPLRARKPRLGSPLALATRGGRRRRRPKAAGGTRSSEDGCSGPKRRSVLAHRPPRPQTVARADHGISRARPLMQSRRPDYEGGDDDELPLALGGVPCRAGVLPAG